jgi:Homeodomain-like domain
MKKKYIIRLSDEERCECEQVIKKLKGSSSKVRRAQILLKADVEGAAWTDDKIADAFNCRRRTVEKLRQRVVVDGFAIALAGKKREQPPTAAKLDGAGEAKLIAMRLGQPPVGYGRWTLQLLADQLVTLEIVERICPETVRKTLKKTA